MELALLHKCGIITTLLFSNYASPIFAQRKPNGKLRLLLDLRKMKTLIADDYINNNHPVSTLTDAAQHMAGKNLFCKLDCSQAYRCLQMVDQQSMELLAFNFASEHSHTEDWHKYLAVPYQYIRASYVNTSIQSSKPINVHNMLTILA